MLHPLTHLGKVKENIRRHAPGGDRTLDLRINFNTVCKYDALTDWATGKIPARGRYQLMLILPVTKRKSY